jgi:tetratricopeptide (TPR) repeat protein
VKTYIKEYIYEASEIDSKVTSRAIALEQVKRMLLEELGTYLESETEVKNYQLTKDQTITLTAGVVRTEILEEKWDGHTYWLKAKLKADANQVAKAIDELRKDRSKMKELEQLKQRSYALLKEIKELRAELTVAKGKIKQGQLTAYNRTIKELTANDWCQKGWTLQRSGSYNDAMVAYNNAIELDPRYAPSYNYRGMVYADLGNFKQAMEDYNKAIALDQKYSVAYSNRGTAYIKLGNFSQAINDFDRAIHLDPDFASAYVNRGGAHSELGNPRQAINDLNKGIELNPNYAAAYNNRGNVHRNLGNLKQALNDFDRAIDLDPGFAAAYYNRGALYGQQLNNFNKGQADIQQAARLGMREAQDLLRRYGVSW